MASKRPTYVNEGWTSEGIARKSWARENKKCAWCGGPIPKGQKLYCSSKCSWRFFNDSRYHSRVLLWTKIRAEVLWENKVCVKCGINLSSEVDHIREIAAGGDPFDKSNLQALCHNCHKKKTVRFLMHQAIVRGRISPRPSTAQSEDRDDRADRTSVLQTPTPKSFILADQSSIEDF